MKDKMKDELKRCPFCGQEAIQEMDINGFYSVECINCTSEINSCKTIDEAIQAWNTRPVAMSMEEIENKIKSFKPKIIIYRNKKGGLSETIDNHWKKDLAIFLHRAMEERK